MQRAIELDAEAPLVAKNGVKGIMTADPKVDSSATVIERMKHEEALARRLRVMDPAAFVLAMEHELTLRVFDVAELGRLVDLCRGVPIGSVVEE